MEAVCQCGQLRVRGPDVSVGVVACHCIACQRRSGSPFGVGAYYYHDQLTVEGEAKRFDRPTDLDGIFENYFCPHCGSTVFFRGTKNPDVTGVAIGAMIDPGDLVPIRSVYEQSRHSWVTIPTAQQRFERGRV